MRVYRLRLLVVLVIFLFSMTLVLITQEGTRVPLRPEQLASTAGVVEFAWSPDGKSIAYIGPAGNGFDLWTIPSGGGEPRRLTSTLRYKKEARWSPDGKWIAFVTVQDDGNADIRAVSANGDRVLTLADTAAEEMHPEWSPESTQIAFTLRIGTRTSIMVVDIDSGLQRKLGDGGASHLRWSPDGKSIVFVADFLQPNDQRRENEDLFLIPADGGVPRLLTPGTPRFRDSAPEWSSDSRHIVYTSDQSGFSNVYILDTQDLSRRPLTGGNTDTITPKWSPDGTMIASVRHENSIFHVQVIYVNDGQTTRVSDRDGVNGGYETANAKPEGMFAWSPDSRRIAFSHSDPAHAPDIWIASVDGTHATQLTNSMPSELRHENRFVWPDRITYRSFDGQEISALVYKPKSARPPSGHPAVLIFRDSLDGEHAVSWDPVIQFLVSNGYLVFAPNVRGSGGSGRAYRQLVAEHGGDYDVRDALFGLDRLSSEGLIDVDKLAVLGSETGAFLTTAALIRSETRFAVAVSINAIVDAVTAASYPETTEWTRYMLGGNPLQNPIAYYERSIVNFVDKLRTPIVFLYAGHNPAAPYQQLQQFAVQAEVKGRWYDYRVFENESGGWRTWRASNMRVALEAIEAVFEKYLLGRDRDIRLDRDRMGPESLAR